MSDPQAAIPAAAWKRRFDEQLPRPGRPSRPRSPRILLQMLPTILGLTLRLRRQVKSGLDPVNLFNPPQPGPVMGVPLGGIGAGSITRGWRGDFRRWQLQPDSCRHGVVYADQFSLYVQRAGRPAQTQVLFPGRPEKGELSAWTWGLDPAGATCHALFPRAWTVYEEPLPGIRLTCRQVSPVIPHNYRESSLPAAVLVWIAENTGAEEATVALMFTLQNGDGSANDLAGGHHNEISCLPIAEAETRAGLGTGDWGLEALQAEDGSGEAVGVALHHTCRQRRAGSGERPLYSDPLTFVIAAEAKEGVEVSTRARFATSGDGGDLWADFAADGRLDNARDPTPSAPGEAIGGAVAATLRLAPGQSRQVAFALAWDMPLIRFGLGRAYRRRYTTFYGAEGDAAPALARDALAGYGNWEARIDAWQAPILADPELPDWYKMALFNELYYLTAGGTVWAQPLEEVSGLRSDEIGHFAYLEGHEYRMYNTYDVHFYASFALALLWPKIEQSLQRDIAASVGRADAELRDYVLSGRAIPRKLAGSVPHDIGMPGEDPWLKVNAYDYHDPNRWKDLAPKLVLQVYRDYVATGDRAFVAEVWPALQQALARLARADSDGDGLIENDGSPDQTYDTWPVRGASAYTGGLWLAALGAAAALAELLGQGDEALAYRTLYDKGRAAYENKLWNGRYYNYDSSQSRYHNSIMADQLAGHWYLRACGLPSFASPEQARSALETVFDYNVLRFQGGSLGAVNGMRPDGWVDRTCMQSQEVWTGSSYALAAAMLQEGLKEEAFRTAQGVCATTYGERGYWFQTPEAWDERGNYRSLAYMRPLAIWAMQWAIQSRL